MKTQVRNGLISNFREYVIKELGDEIFTKWLNALKEAPSRLYSEGRFAEKWYDAEEYYIEPAVVLCRLTEGGRTNVIWNSGAWAAGGWIKGLIKFIVDKISVETLLKHFLPPSATYYYRPVKIIKISVKKGEAVFYIEGMHGAESMMAYRFGGGVEKVLELKGCKNILVQISTSHEKFADTTVFFITWE